MRAYLTAQGTRLNALCGPKWEGNGKKRGDVCTRVADSLCCTIEINTIL